MDKERRRPRRSVRALVMVIVAVLLLAGAYAGSVAIRHARPVALPAPGGSYAVGRILTDWVDHTRTDPLAPQPSTARRLAIWMWYPAAAGGRPGSAPYTPGRWAHLHLPGVAGLAETRFDAVRTHSAARAPVAAGRFPVVVLLPGLGFAAAQYSSIGENLASDGYLVVGVTPTYSANLTVLGDAVVRSSEAGNPRAFDGEQLHSGAAQQAGDRLATVWSADARFAAAQAQTLDRSGPFAGHVDPARVAYVGHSLGGASALQACQDDPRCAAAANLDGTQFGPVVRTGLDHPMLTMASEDACVTGVCRPATTADETDRSVARALLAAGSGPAWAYQVRGMHHLNFTDYDAFYLAAPLRKLLGLGSVPRGRGLIITNAYLAAFLDHAVRGVDEPLLSETSNAFPEVRRQATARG